MCVKLHEGEKSHLRGLRERAEAGAFLFECDEIAENKTRNCR